MPGRGGERSAIRLRLLAPERVRVGEPVRLTLQLVNAGGRPATLYLQGRPPAFDFTVHDAGGRVIWRRLAGQVVPAILGVRELAPGSTLEFADVWSQRDASGRAVPPGSYTVTGTLPGEPGRSLRSQPVTITLVAGPE